MLGEQLGLRMISDKLLSANSCMSFTKREITNYGMSPFPKGLCVTRPNSMIHFFLPTWCFHGIGLAGEAALSVRTCAWTQLCVRCVPSAEGAGQRDKGRHEGGYSHLSIGLGTAQQAVVSGAEIQARRPKKVRTFLKFTPKQCSAREWGVKNSWSL